MAEKSKADSTKAPAPRPGLFSTRYAAEDDDIVYRKHLSVWFLHILLPLMLIIAGLVVVVIGFSAFDLGPLATVGSIGGFLMIFVGVIWFYWADWDWRNDLLILGKDTITIVHKRPLFLQNISDKILLNRVDSVISDRRGVLDTLLNRGLIKISLLGDDKSAAKIFDNVHNPNQVQEDVSGRRSAVINKVKEEEVQRQRREIAEYIDVYHERINTLQPQAAPAPASPPPTPTPATDSSQPVIRGGPRPPRVPRTHGSE